MNAIYQDLTNRCGMTESAAAEALTGYEIIPIINGDVTIGHFAKQGHEIHTAVFPEHRQSGRGRAVFKAFLKMLESDVFLVTRVPVGDEFSRSITERSGFKKTRSDGVFDYFWLDTSTCPGGRKNAT
jgi:hypothetical protein